MKQLSITKLRQIEMVVARGYEIDEDESELLEINDPENNFDNMYNLFKSLYMDNNNKDFLFIPQNQKSTNTRIKLSNFYSREKKNKNDNEYLLVYYASDNSSNQSKDLSAVAVKEALNNIKKYIRNITETDSSITDDNIDIIIISPVKINGEKINNVLGQLKNIQVFYDGNLTNNPTEHKHYNVHIKLSDEEKYKVLKEAGVKLNQTTIIREGDAISRWFGYKPGDLIKVIRDSTIVNISSTSLQYRHCV